MSTRVAWLRANHPIHTDHRSCARCPRRSRPSSATSRRCGRPRRGAATSSSSPSARCWACWGRRTPRVRTPRCFLSGLGVALHCAAHAPRVHPDPATHLLAHTPLPPHTRSAQREHGGRRACRLARGRRRPPRDRGAAAPAGGARAPALPHALFHWRRAAGAALDAGAVLARPGGPWRRPSARVRGKRSILSDSRTHTRGKKTLPPVHTPPPAQDALEPRTLLAAFQFAVASEATRARLVAEFSGHPASPPCMRHFRRARPRAALPLTEAGWAAFECACCPAEEGLPRRVPTLQAPPPPPPLPQGAAPAQLCVQARV